MPKIDPQDYPGNSILPKKVEIEPSNQKKVEKVATARLLKKKKTFMETIFGEHAKDVGDYILFDVLIPAAKNTISDIISNGIEMILYGEPRSDRRRDKNRSYVSYTKFYDRDREREHERREPLRSRPRNRFDDIILDTRPDAEEVLSNLVEIVETYGVASIADLYDLVGLPGEYTDNKYGWDNLSTAGIQRVRLGYILVLPRAEPIGS